MAYSPEVAIDVKHLQEEETVKGKHGGRRLSWHLLLRWWKSIITMSSVLSISVDPLFLYIPITNEDMKCLSLDQNLKIVTLLLRLAVDLPCIVQIISQILASRLQRAAWSCFLIDILAILPIPQVVILILPTRMRGSKSLNERKFLNSLILFQYFPRIFRMYLSCKANKEKADNARYGNNGHRIWLRVYKFILACHVFGAFWYFFSIQRETSCWHRACVNNSTDVEGCMSTLYCEVHNIAARNATFLDQFCPISAEENAKAPFDFGIFLDSLKNGITGDIHFGTKLSYSFWWGLRNLSNFGTNLETSTYVWETCFAIFISVIGLLLFLYLIGNVQTFMSMETQRWEDIRNKIQLKEKDIAEWMDRNELPDDMKKEIMKNIKQKLEENKDADLENLFSVLPIYTKKCLKRFLCMKTLKKVPKLERMDEIVLKMMCDYLKPVMYAEGTVVLQMGDPLHSMLLITEGTLLTYRTTSNDSHVATENAKMGSIPSSPSVGNLDKGDFYGAEELIEWVTQKKDLGQLPGSAFNVKCDSKVEGFVLAAKDLRSVVSKCENWWKIGISQSDHSKC